MFSSPTTMSEPSSSEDGEQKPEKRSRKRDRSHDSDDQNSDFPAKRREKSSDVLFRIVVPSKQIGRVIGLEGIRIQKIREQTKATIKIADAVARFEDRVIIISSKDGDREISDAESALYCIAEVILKENDSGNEALEVVARHAAPNTIRLLIAGSQAGCLIGISGQNITNIRNSTGANVVVMPQNQLPSCASASQSDRLVQVSGEIPDVLKALEKIGCNLRENPAKSVISLRPTNHFTSATFSGYSMPSNGPTIYHQYAAIPASAETVTSEIMVPETLVGGLIGKQGSNISKIRKESGALIKVTGERGEKDQRRIHFVGSAQQVCLAKMLVESYIESQMLQLQPG